MELACTNSRSLPFYLRFLLVRVKGETSKETEDNIVA